MAEQTSSDNRPTKPAPRRRLGILPDRIPVRGTILVLLSVLIVLGVIFGTAATLRMGRFTGTDWRNFTVNGVARGSIYALIAMGYTLVYGILFLINFAHGEVFMAGAFTSFFVAAALSEHGTLDSAPIPSVLLILVVAMLTSMLVAMLLERVAYRPLRGAPRLVPLITAIGASLFLQYTFRGLYSAQAQGYPIPQLFRGNIELFGVPFKRAEAVVIISAIVLVTILSLFISRTRTGRSMRAVGEDKEIASLMGINVDRTIVTTFALGGLLAGAAGILYVLLFQQVIFTMGVQTGIKAFTAAVLGGIGSVAGAAIGGLVLGLLETVFLYLFLSGANIPGLNQLQPVVAFGILVLVLIFRPGGILGVSEEKRA